MIRLSRADEVGESVYIDASSICSVASDPSDRTTWIYLVNGQKWNVTEKPFFVMGKIEREIQKVSKR